LQRQTKHDFADTGAHRNDQILGEDESEENGDRIVEPRFRFERRRCAPLHVHALEAQQREHGGSIG
jgi:hypothetical protein